MEPEDPYVQQLAAESVVSSTGMTLDQAFEALAYHDATLWVLDDIDRALGEEAGEIWLEWSDHDVRLKIGVTAKLAPSRVDAAREILKGAEVLDGADFVAVRWSKRELKAGATRAARCLATKVPAADIGVWVHTSTNCLVIRVADDVTAEERQVVDEAIRAAGVSVRVEAGSSRIDLE